jgi:hypothetical protein
MKDNRDNGLLLAGIIVGTFLLTVAWVTACQSSPPEIFQGICSLIGGAIGAGGAAVAVFLTLRGQQADERNQTLTSLYIEIAAYLWPTVNSHSVIAGVYKPGVAASPVDNNIQVFLRSALNMAPSVFFPANDTKLARLDDPQLVRAFYARLDIMRAQKNRPGMEGVETAPSGAQLFHVLQNLSVMMMVGIGLLEAPDFAEIQPDARKQLVESLKDSLNKSPIHSFPQLDPAFPKTAESPKA